MSAGLEPPRGIIKQETEEPFLEEVNAEEQQLVGAFETKAEEEWLDQEIAQARELLAEWREIHEEQRVIADDHQGIYEEHQRIATIQQRIATDHQHIREEQQERRKEHKRIAADQERIGADQERIAADQERIGADQERIAADQERLEADFRKIREEQQRIAADQEAILVMFEELHVACQRSLAAIREAIQEVDEHIERNFGGLDATAPPEKWDQLIEEDRRRREQARKDNLVRLQKQAERRRRREFEKLRQKHPQTLKSTPCKNLSRPPSQNLPQSGPPIGFLDFDYWLLSGLYVAIIQLLREFVGWLTNKKTSNKVPKVPVAKQFRFFSSSLSSQNPNEVETATPDPPIISGVQKNGF